MVLDLLQLVGVAAAIGVRPYLATAVVAALGLANAGVDYGGTTLAFLESPELLVLALLAGVAAALAPPAQAVRVAAGTAGLALVLGALEGGATLDDRHDTWWYGLLLGLACAALGAWAVRGLVERVRARLDASTARTLPVYAELAAGLAAGLSVALPPVGLVVVAGLAVLGVRGRRRAGEKYAGLRILR